MTRIFTVADYTRPNGETVERTVIHQTTEAALVVWHLLPGQEIPPHRHPAGQDTWTVVSGEADYLLGDGKSRAIKVGDVAIAAIGQIHGARNRGGEPFVFVSVVSPAEAGYELIMTLPPSKASDSSGDYAAGACR